MINYFGQFKEFNPLSGEVPESPFSLMPLIALRARALLKARTLEQIESISMEIDYAIYCYFVDIKNNEINRLNEILREPRRWKNELDDGYEYALKFFEWDEGSVENGRWLFKEDMEDELNIQNKFNTGEVYVLKQLSESWGDFGRDISDFESYELFAILSLWNIADSLNWLQYKREEVIKSLDDDAANILKELDDKLSDKENRKETNLSLAGEASLNAMESVCYAEHLKSVGEIKNAYLVREKRKQEDEAYQKSIRAKQLNIARHQKRNDAMQKVIEEWEKSISNWPSAEKAGLYFADWLLKQGYEYEPRTVTGWLRGHAKQIRVKFR